MCFRKQVMNRESLFSKVFFKIPFRINYYLTETKRTISFAWLEVQWCTVCPGLLHLGWMSRIKIRT